MQKQSAERGMRRQQGGRDKGVKCLGDSSRGGCALDGLVEGSMGLSDSEDLEREVTQALRRCLVLSAARLASHLAW